jgi:peroxiredoxin (alkyl hydroperoxide reductase subunit C)
MEEAEAQAALRMPLIGDDAPAFEAKTTKGMISFPKDYKGKWVILFSHPADFTPVCTTEFMGFAAIHEELRAMNTELIGLSIDSIYAHIAWLRTIEEKIEFGGRKGVHIDFPVIEDLTMEVARKYGMLQPAASTTQAVRAVFVIDPKGKVRAVIYYPLSNGRNMDEILRLIQAMQFTDEHGLATPANWRPGDEAIIPPPGTTDAAVDRVAGKDGGHCLDWFLCLKKP